MDVYDTREIKRVYISVAKYERQRSLTAVTVRLWTGLAQDRVKWWTFMKSIMYISMKLNPILHIYYSQSSKKVSDRLRADLGSVSHVTIRQKAWTTSRIL